MKAFLTIDRSEKLKPGFHLKREIEVTPVGIPSIWDPVEDRWVILPDEREFVWVKAIGCKRLPVGTMVNYVRPAVLNGAVQGYRFQASVNVLLERLSGKDGNTRGGVIADEVWSEEDPEREADDERV